MNKDDQAKQALKDSIKHWESNLGRVQLHILPNISTVNCALCQKFLLNQSAEDSCAGCLVNEKIGKTYCKDTPYQKVQSPSMAIRRGVSENWSDLEAATRQELDFLESLLPPEAE